MTAKKNTKKKLTEDETDEEDFFFNLNDVENEESSEKIVKKPKRRTIPIEELKKDDEQKIEDIQTEQPEESIESREITDLTDPDLENDWIEDEDQLSIDVFQDNSNIYIKSPLPGVEPEDIDVSIDNDMVTLKAKRDWSHVVEEDDYFFRENYWGSLSRSIILPVEIKADKVDATLKNGILTVILPKAKSSKGINVKVKGED